MRTRALNHSVYQHQYHIVWGTKYRRKYLKPYVKKELISSLFDTVKEYPTLHIERVNTNEDHIHLQIEIAPDVSVARVVQRLKSASSLHLKQKFKFIREMYLDTGVWSVGYFSSTVGLNEEQIAKYIAWQGKRDFPKQSTLAFS